MSKIFSSIFFRAVKGWGVIGLFKMLYFEFSNLIIKGPATFLNIGYKSSSHKAKENYNIPTPYVYLYYLRNILKDKTDYTFIDIGSGTGRVIQFAIDMNFKKIISVEKSIKLNKILKKKFGDSIHYIENEAENITFDDSENKIFFFFESFNEEIFFEFIKRHNSTTKLKKLLIVLIYSNSKNILDQYLEQFEIYSETIFSQERKMVVLSKKL